VKSTSRPNSHTRSWKEIRQNATRKVVTSHARKRVVMAAVRGVLLLAVVAALGVGGYYGVQHWQQGVERVNTVLPAQPLREIRFETDGVLTQAWVENVLELPEEVDIMAINIHQLKAKIEAHGQVRSVVIRRASDRLEIVVQERSPVVRLKTHNEQGQVVELLVDREGHVYRGFGYTRHEISSLLYLDGVRLHRGGAGFRRLAGIDQIDDLLRVARGQFPHLVRSWRVVDCRDLPRLTVRSDDTREIVFGDPERYMEQLRWLDMVLVSNRRQMMAMQDRIDLSLGNQVVVR
jgi:hypothetical protein